MLCEERAEAFLLQKVIQRSLFRLMFQPGLAAFIETHDFHQKTPEARLKQVTALCKQRAQRMAVVLKAAAIVAHREAHLGRLAFQPQLGNQRQKTGIGPIVKDDKTGINRPAFALQLNVNRRGMSAQRVTGFIQMHVGFMCQLPGTAEPGNAAAHNRNSQRLPRYLLGKQTL